MSTRCNIIITSRRAKRPVILYHHHDGKPTMYENPLHE